MKSSEKISNVSAELKVQYETVQGLTYKKKFQKTSIEDPQHHFTAAHFVQNTCADYLVTAQSFELLTSDNSDVLTRSHILDTKRESIITKLHTAGSVISLY
jgi:hypothetical protein